MACNLAQDGNAQAQAISKEGVNAQKPTSSGGKAVMSVERRMTTYYSSSVTRRGSNAAADTLGGLKNHVGMAFLLNRRATIH